MVKNRGSSDRSVYRGRVRADGLTGFSVRVDQTDLFIRAAAELTEKALDIVLLGRRRIESWGLEHPDFYSSLKPLPDSPLAPPPVREMLRAGRLAGTGPMAAVAGAMAEFVGSGLLPHSPEGVIVENGGDVYLNVPREVTAGLFAGASPLSLKVGFRFTPEMMPLGVCTSSGTVGHSLSLGRADAALVAARSTAVADAAATALGNRVRNRQDIEPALEWVLTVEGVIGAAVVLGEDFGLSGGLNLVSLT